MPALSRWKARFHALFNRDALDRDFDRELSAWVDELAAREEARGVSPPEARRRAVHATGGLNRVKDRVRDVRPRWFLEGVFSDVAYAARGLRRSPGLVFTIVVTLALGIGANAAVYSIVHALLFEPPPYEAPERLAFILARMGVAGSSRAVLAGPEVVDFQQNVTKLGSLAAIRPASAALTGHGDPEQLRVAHVSWNFFDVLGVGAARGRTFARDDGAPSPGPPAVISWPFFQRRFGGDASAIGRRIVLNDQLVTVVGVLPAGFRLQFRAEAGVADEPQVFQVFGMDLAQTHRLLRYYHVVGRLAPGATFDEAARDVESIAAELARQHSFYTVANHSFYLVPLLSDTTQPVRPMLLALLGGVVVVLFAACVNVAGLLLARAVARRREVATLLALGADRRRLSCQFVAEGLIIAAAGAAAGLVTGFVALRVIVALRPPGLDRLTEARIDTPVFLVVLGIACVWGVFFALAPLAEARRLSVAAGLQTLSPANGRLRYRTRSILVIAQIALGTALIVSASLLVRTMDALHNVDTGFETGARALTFRLALPASRYPDSGRTNAFSRELESRLAAIPGVERVGAISHLPFDTLGNWSSKYFPEGPGQNLSVARLADTRAVTPNTLQTLGIQLIDGRWFTEDDDDDSRDVVVVDERLAARTWPGRRAVGQRIHVPFLKDRRVVTTWAIVVGVVRHMRYRTPDAEVQEQLYFPFRQNLRDPMAYVVRTAFDPSSIAADVRRVVASLDPLLPTYEMTPLETYVSRAMSTRRFTAFLIGSFAFLALALAGVGLAGLVAYSVASRHREFGIRLALGATPGRVRGTVLSEGFLLVICGVGFGLVGAGVSAYSMRALLFGVTPSDLTSYVAAVLVLGATGLVASWWPARRAMRVNPVHALRAE